MSDSDSATVEVNACGLQHDEYMNDPNYRLVKADAFGRVYEEV